MAAKHARHDMREDKNFKGTDPSETTAQYLYCVLGSCPNLGNNSVFSVREINFNPSPNSNQIFNPSKLKHDK